MADRPRLRSAVEVADDFAAATDRLVDNIGLGQDEVDAFAAAIARHQRRARIPEWAIQHGAQRLYRPDDHPPGKLAEHMADCLDAAEKVLTGVAEAGFLIARPPSVSLCPDHGLPRCTRCPHDGVNTP